MNIDCVEILKTIFGQISLNNGFFAIDLGFVVAAVGLVITIANYFYTKPKISIYKSLLYIEPYFFNHEPETIDEIFSRNSRFQIRYHLEIFIRNSKGGQGSITKPVLQIKVKQKLFHWKTIMLEPSIEHQESQQINANTTSYWIVREGASYNLPANSHIDDLLNYSCDFTNSEEDKRFLKSLALSTTKISYKLKYNESSGKERTKKITNIHNARERDLY